VTADTALMDPKSPDDRPQAAAPQPQPLEWRFAQVFGERGAGEDVQEGNPPARMPRPSAPRLAPREIYSVSWCGLDAAAPRAFHRGMRGSPRFGHRRPLRIDRMIVSRLLPRLRLVPGTVPSISSHIVFIGDLVRFVAKCRAGPRVGISSCCRLC
jgi:hypothetical protein